MTKFNAHFWAWKQPDLNQQERTVLTVIADRCIKSLVCWPSQETLAADARMPVRTVQRCIANLAEEGYLDKYVPNVKTGLNHYRLTPERRPLPPATLAGTTRQSGAYHPPVGRVPPARVADISTEVEVPNGSTTYSPSDCSRPVPVRLDSKINDKDNPVSDDENYDHNDGIGGPSYNSLPSIAVDVKKAKPADMVKYFRAAWHEKEWVAFVQSDHKKAVALFRQLMEVDGIAPERIEMMIDRYVKGVKTQPDRLPLNDFIKAKVLLLDVTETRTAALKQQADSHVPGAWTAVPKFDDGWTK